MTWGVCADPAIGYDLSHWQGTAIPWAAARALGVRWVVSKTWHGAGVVKSAAPQLDTAREAGIEILGRYAWLLPDDDLARQTNAWLATPRRRDELPLSIDFEHPDTKLRGSALLTKLEHVIEVVSDALGERPIVYTGEWYWRDYVLDLDSEIVASCPLWLAAYPRKNSTGTRYTEAVAEVCGGVMPRVCVPWRRRNFEPVKWQFDGDKGLYLTSGGDVDVNVADWSRMQVLVSPPRRESAPVHPDVAATRLGSETMAEFELAQRERLPELLTRDDGKQAKPKDPE